MNIKDINEFKHHAKWKWCAILKRDRHTQNLKARNFSSQRSCQSFDLSLSLSSLSVCLSISLSLLLDRDQVKAKLQSNKKKDVNRLIYVHFAEQITSTAFVTQATSQEEYIFLKQPSLGLRLRSAYQGFALSPSDPFV